MFLIVTMIQSVCVCVCVCALCWVLLDAKVTDDSLNSFEIISYQQNSPGTLIKLNLPPFALYIS